MPTVYQQRLLSLFHDRGSIVTVTMNAATDQVETIFEAQEAMTIDRLWYAYAAIVGTAPVMQISLQGTTIVSGFVVPDGTIKSSGNAKATFTPAGGTVNTGFWATLTSSYTCTRGERLAIVISLSSGTLDGSNTVTFASGLGSASPGTFPLAINNNAGSRVRSNNPRYGYSDGTNFYGYPVKSQTAQLFHSGNTPDEYALRFVMPTTLAGEYAISGMRAAASFPVAGSSCVFTLYDGTTALQTVTVPFDIAVTLGSTQTPMHLFDEATLSTLVAGNVYRLGVFNNHASSQMSLSIINFESNSDMNQLWGGTECYLSHRTDGGAWTDDTAKRPLIEPLFSTIDQASGGGVIGGPNMRGGMAA